MVRLAIILGVIAVVFVVYSLVDSIVTDPRRIRALPKPVWILITLIPIFGAILWLTLGKLRGTAAVRASRAPDDDPDFLRSLGSDGVGSDKDRNSRIQDLEKRLAELDDDDDSKK
jgi:hypothetical protein